VNGDTPEGRAKVIAEEPVGRMGKPEEIAEAVIWLCWEGAAFMIGHAMGDGRRPNGSVIV
jgi:NAD(P)-dependent dehydrogenase (short-subunit alcohol dehydrogenase family)